MRPRYLGMSSPPYILRWHRKMNVLPVDAKEVKP